MQVCNYSMFYGGHFIPDAVYKMKPLLLIYNTRLLLQFYKITFFYQI